MEKQRTIKYIQVIILVKLCESIEKYHVVDHVHNGAGASTQKGMNTICANAACVEVETPVGTPKNIIDSFRGTLGGVRSSADWRQGIL